MERYEGRVGHYTGEVDDYLAFEQAMVRWSAENGGQAVPTDVRRRIREEHMFRSSGPGPGGQSPANATARRADRDRDRESRRAERRQRLVTDYQDVLIGVPASPRSSDPSPADSGYSELIQRAMHERAETIASRHDLRS